MQLLAVQIEILMGAWLILGRLRVTAWLSALVLLLTLTAVSLTSALRGQSDCGCFGDVKVHPGVTAAINLAAITVLAVFRPPVRWSEKRVAVGGAAVLALIGFGLAVVANGPLGDKLLARWEGRTVALRMSVVDAGEEPSGTGKRLTTTVVNSSPHVVRLIGGSVGCRCTTTRNLPLTVPAGGEAEVELLLTFQGTPGHFDHTFELFTDDKTQPKLHGVIVGRVADPPP